MQSTFFAHSSVNALRSTEIDCAVSSAASPATVSSSFRSNLPSQESRWLQPFQRIGSSKLLGYQALNNAKPFLDVAVQHEIELPTDKREKC